MPPFQDKRPPVPPFPYEQRTRREILPESQRRVYRQRYFNSVIVELNMPVAGVIIAGRIAPQPLLVSVCNIQNPDPLANMFVGFSDAIAASGVPEGFIVPPFQNITLSTEESASETEIEVFDLYTVFVTFSVLANYRIPVIWSVK